MAGLAHSRRTCNYNVGLGPSHIGNASVQKETKIAEDDVAKP